MIPQLHISSEIKVQELSQLTETILIDEWFSTLNTLPVSLKIPSKIVGNRMYRKVN